MGITNMLRKLLAIFLYLCLLDKTYAMKTYPVKRWIQFQPSMDQEQVARDTNNPTHRHNRYTRQRLSRQMRSPIGISNPSMGVIGDSRGEFNDHVHTGAADGSDHQRYFTTRSDYDYYNFLY